MSCLWPSQNTYYCTPLWWYTVHVSCSQSPGGGWRNKLMTQSWSFSNYPRDATLFEVCLSSVLIRHSVESKVGDPAKQTLGKRLEGWQDNKFKLLPVHQFNKSNFDVLTQQRTSHFLICRAISSTWDCQLVPLLRVLGGPSPWRCGCFFPLLTYNMLSMIDLLRPGILNPFFDCRLRHSSHAPSSREMSWASLWLSQDEAPVLKW